jgi:hypothetical protein
MRYGDVQLMVEDQSRLKLKESCSVLWFGARASLPCVARLPRETPSCPVWCNVMGIETMI